MIEVSPCFLFLCQVGVPDLAESVKGADILIFVVPHQFIMRVCDTIKSVIKKDAVGMSLIKVFLNILLYHNGMGSHQFNALKNGKYALMIHRGLCGYLSAPGCRCRSRGSEVDLTGHQREPGHHHDGAHGSKHRQ